MLGSNLTAGEKDAAVLEYNAVPATIEVPCIKVYVADVIVAESIGTLKVADSLPLIDAFVALLIGFVEVTFGDVPESSSFLHPVMKTTISNAMVGKTLVKFIIIWFYIIRIIMEQR
jgi:hypothetical protein